MELRLLSESDRAAFMCQLEGQRAEYREPHAQRRLEHSRLYGLFIGREMVAGIAIHSCREAIAECGWHWSVAMGAGLVVWVGLAVPLRLLGIRTVIVYLAVGEHAGFYRLMGFVPSGSVIRHPFVEDLDGEPVRVQPMTLHGCAFDRAMAVLSKFCVGHSDDTFELGNNAGELIRELWTPQ